MLSNSEYEYANHLVVWRVMKPSKKNMTYNSSARGRVWSLHIEGMPSAVFKDGKKPLLQANIAEHKHLNRGELKAISG